MIEVEIRGKLTESEFNKLFEFLGKEGKLIENHSREMYLLYDYPGYDKDPTKREVDIRLRNTDGFCEIMLKHKAGKGNTARKEISLSLKDNTLDKAKEIVKALGCTKALKMIREKQVFEYQGIEWSLVNCPPKNIKYFEAELIAQDEGKISEVKEKLIKSARDLGLSPLDDSEMRDFIYHLDEQVNVEVYL